MPRKNAKTATLAAFAVYRIFDEGNPEILLVRFLGEAGEQAVRLLRQLRTPKRGVAPAPTGPDHEGEIIREDGLGKIVRMSSDPRRLHGYGPTLVVADELAQWTTPQLERAYAALTSGGGARSKPQMFTITTAGEAHQRHESILGGSWTGRSRGEGNGSRD